MNKVAPHARRTVASVLLAIALLVPTTVLAAQQLVIVRKGGQMSTHTLPAHAAKGGGAAAMAVCDDASVAFAFVAEPRDTGTVELQRGVDASRDLVIDVSVTCSTLAGTALVPFDAVAGTAVAGVDYRSIAGMASLDLAAAANSPGSTPSVAAVVRVEVLDNVQAGSAPVTLSIQRRDGSFQGSWPDGTPTVGVIPGSSEALVSISILNPAAIDDEAGRIPGIDPAAETVAIATAAFCASGGGGAGSAGCRATQRAADRLADPSTPGAQRDAAIRVLENNLLAIAPDETTALAFVAPRLASGQIDNVGLRLAAMRSGGGSGISTEGLMLRGSGMPISLSGLPMLLHADDESAANEEKRTLIGGTRLGFWINGTIGAGERERRGTAAGFDSDVHELTAGLDYRFTDRFFAGAALGISRFDADFDRDQGSIEADARSLHAYAGYSLDNGLAFDGSLSTMRSDYKQRRVIELYELDAAGTGIASLGRDVARGKVDVDQVAGSLGVTWTFMRGVWTIAPQAQLALVRTDYGAFTETGSSTFNLDYSSQERNGRSFSIGSYLDRTFATGVGAFRPYLRAFVYADSGSSRDLVASFALANDDGSQASFRLPMVEPDRHYGSAELGLGFSRPIGTRTVDFNAGYMQMFGFEGWDRYALRLDVRIPL